MFCILEPIARLSEPCQNIGSPCFTQLSDFVVLLRSTLVLGFKFPIWKLMGLSTSHTMIRLFQFNLVCILWQRDIWAGKSYSGEYIPLVYC